MATPKSYVRVYFNDAKMKPVILEVTGQTDRFLIGFEVSKDGDRRDFGTKKEWDAGNSTERKHMIEFAVIKRQVPMKMNNTYAELEDA